nr:immunoglobulin heavy chain junction region [Macaca mulatta]MOV53965.1 immunoglobulin heavy chain junction region [Macaca mulatta]MOV54252.1 immunoglobulin heavy chain junction region [Macaca mulatta]MOV57018.1 immunoglobulin heavy chain junction region [Macaca mulatta]MOV58636.1 immunoglobulin heavy chain junction region [Macaca mulatta]
CAKDSGNYKADNSLDVW